MTDTASQPPSAPDDTRQRLIAAGFRLFGEAGFAATSTRRLAEAAQTNVASISYHFGSKAGLHEACARAVIERVSAIAGVPQDHAGISAEAAAARLEQLVRGMTHFVATDGQATEIVEFITRELNASPAIADLLYDEFIGAKHRELCQLWSAATGLPEESEEVRLAVFAMIGQVVYFRIGQRFVLRRMGWTRIGPEEAARLADLLAANLHSALERSRS